MENKLKVGHYYVFSYPGEDICYIYVVLSVLPDKYLKCKIVHSFDGLFDVGDILKIGFGSMVYENSKCLGSNLETIKAIYI